MTGHLVRGRGFGREILRVKQIGFGARLGYSVVVNVEQERPERTPALTPATAQ